MYTYINRHVLICRFISFYYVYILVIVYLFLISLFGGQPGSKTSHAAKHNDWANRQRGNQTSSRKVSE